MWTHEYVGEKLRELDAEMARRDPFRPPLDARFVRRPAVRPGAMPGPGVGSLMRVTGRALHWIGGALQRTGHRWRSWGALPAVEGDVALVVAAPDTSSSLLSWWKEGC